MKLKTIFTIVLLWLSGANMYAEATPPNGELFYINGSMGRLAAEISLPPLEANQKCPMVIFSHGFGGDMRYNLWDSITVRLNETGIGALRFDFNGHGQSQGEFVDMTVPNEIEDLLAVIAYTRVLPSTASIALVGHSMGGVVTSMTAGECNAPQIACEVLLAPAACLREDALRGTTMGSQYNPWHLDQPYVEIWGGKHLGRPFIQSAISLPIYETAQKYRGPALVINGMADQLVPYTYAQLYHKLLPLSQLILIPGEDHGFTQSTSYVANLVSDYLIHQLTSSQK